MKKLLYLGIVLMLASCGPEIEEGFATIQGVGLATIKIGDLEVMTQDLGKMTWDNAKNACKGLGDGWRLPTKDELKSLYENKKTIGGFFNNTSYWSSSEHSVPDAFLVYFINGEVHHFLKYKTYSVRAVRSH